MATYTEGIFGDQPAILKDGELVTFDQVLKDLNEAHAGCGAVVRLNNLLSCADVAEGMNANKKQIVVMDESHNVRELDMAKYGINDNVILVYVKRVEI